MADLWQVKKEIKEERDLDLRPSSFEANLTEVGVKEEIKQEQRQDFGHSAW